jgi:hypothetical protein
MNTYGGERIIMKNSGAGIGYGKKFDFTKSLVSSPESSHYNLKAVFDANKEKRRGITIGTSREVAFTLYRKSYLIPILTKENSKIQGSPDIILKRRQMLELAERLPLACAIGRESTIKQGLLKLRM